MKDSAAKLIAYAIIFVTLSVPTALYQHGTKSVVTATVTGKERVTTGSGDSMSHRYLVFTDQGTFQNTDAFFHLKYRSSDIQGQLQAGQEYEFSVYGWRIPFFSMYKNIITAVPVSE